MNMRTRHWVFGIGLPITLIANGVLQSQATEIELNAAQQVGTYWVPLIIQLFAGLRDLYKNSGKN